MYVGFFLFVYGVALFFISPYTFTRYLGLATAAVPVVLLARRLAMKRVLIRRSKMLWNNSSSNTKSPVAPPMLSVIHGAIGSANMIFFEEDVAYVYDVGIPTQRRLQLDHIGAYYYSALYIPVNGIVPHIVLDSPKALGKKSRLAFTSSQKVSVSSALDDVFSTHIPTDYSRDSLQILTPEVIELLVQLDDYDVEFKDSGLFAFSKLRNERDLSELFKIGKELSFKLNDHVHHYKDLKSSAGMSYIGGSLLSSPLKYDILTFIPLIPSLLLIYPSQKSYDPIESHMSTLPVLLVALGVSYSFAKKAHLIRKHNKAAIQLHRRVQ